MLLQDSTGWTGNVSSTIVPSSHHVCKIDENKVQMRTQQRAHYTRTNAPLPASYIGLEGGLYLGTFIYLPP